MWSQKSKRLILLVMIIVFAFSSAMSTTRRDQLEGMAMVLTGAWRSVGNSLLELNSDIKSGIWLSIDFEEEDYPVPSSTDKSFYTKSRIDQAMGGPSNLQSFKLLCGVTQEEGTRVTDVVFWSQNNWAGTKQRFTCGGGNPESYDISGVLTGSPQSLCLVTDKTRADRKDRCINGPRCDDHQQNSNESDVDCGGSCSDCIAGKHCNSNADCRSNICNSSHICVNPTCNDGLKNQNESDIDCGGVCSDCINGRHCNSNSDCQSGNCQSGTCQPLPTCNGTPATSSAQNWGILVEYANHCGDVRIYFANTLSEAKSCAQNAGWITVPQMCDYWVQVDTGWQSLQHASTEQHVLDCVRNTLCSNCSSYVVQTVQCIYQQ